MVVQHNLRAMNSNRMLGLTASSQSKSTEKLSSGYKINRAADDAAGLFISEKMRRQIRGLTQATLNAQDGISAVQTAEGALTEVHDMLQRMDELATKAANGTMQKDDRQAVQDEIDQLITEIDRVSATTTFNEMELLKGGGTGTQKKTVPGKDAVPVQAEYASGKGGSGSIGVVTGKGMADVFGSGNTSVYLADSSTAITSLADVVDYLEIDTDGTSIKVKDGVQFYKTAASDTAEWGAQTDANKVTVTTTGTFQINSTAVSTTNDSTGIVKADELADHFNDDGTMKDKLYAQNTSGTWVEIGADRIDEFVKVTKGQAAVGETEVDEEYTKALEFNLHVGAEAADDNKIKVKIEAMSAKGIGVDTLKTDGVMTEDSATSAINTIKAAVAQVSKQRSTLGAVQNRLEHTINNLENVVENTTAAESQIRDTDMATEMVRYSNNNILAQAGQAMLAQSNQANQGVLSLLQ